MNEATSTSPRRRRRWLLWLSAVAFFALVQSITVTPSIDARFVDETTGAPLADMPVTAVWQLESATPAGGMRTGALKVQHLSTNASGEIDVTSAVLVHWPVFPFGFGVRNATWMPALYVVTDQYANIVAGGSSISGEPHPWSLLLLQRSALNGATIRLQPDTVASDPVQQRDNVAYRSYLNYELYQAEQACQSMLCQKDAQ